MKSGDSNDPNDREETNERTEAKFGLRSGLSGLFDLLRTLDEAGEHRSFGHLSSTGPSVDYGVTIGAGLGNSRTRSGRRSRRSGRGRSSPDQHAHGDYHVTSRENGEGIVVFADLPGVDAGDLTVGLEGDGDTLLIAVGGAAVKRLSLPWAARAERSSFNNGVLEVHLREKS